MAGDNTLYLRLRDVAALALIDLPGWERERLADILVQLTIDPRPPSAVPVEEVEGEAYRIWSGDRRAHYKVYKDDEDTDRNVIVYAIS